MGDEKKTNRYALGFCVLIVVMLLGILTGAAGAKEALWIEGEDPNYRTSSNWVETWGGGAWYHDTSIDKTLLSPGVPAVVNGNWHSTFGIMTPCTATYEFDIYEGGTYTWWIRLNPFRNSNGGANYTFSIDGGPWTPIDVTDAAKNAIDLVNPGIDIRFIAWAYGSMFNFSPGTHHQISIKLEPRSGDVENHGGIDVMALVNFAWAPGGVNPPDPNAPPPGPADWFILVAGPDQFSDDSIIDVCDLLDKPAGVHGLLQRDGNDFRFEDGTPIKFWGCDAGMVDTVESQQRQARFYTKHGINMLRMHAVFDILGPMQGPPGGRYLDAAELDKLDRWFSILKEHGIYVTWSLFYHHVVLPDEGIDPNLYNELPASGSGKDTYGYATFIQEYQDSQWEYANLVLSHVNPYTGLAYKDDPALAVVECRNEDSVFFHNPLSATLTGSDPSVANHRLRLRILWHNWVKNTYVTDANLTAAWGAGKRAGDSVNADPNTSPMYMYAAWEMGTDGPYFNKSTEKKRMGDFIKFLAEMQRTTYETYQSRLRSIGFDGITISTAWPAGGPAAQAANTWTDDAMDAIDRHAYYGGGEHPWMITDQDYDGDGVAGEVDNNTMLASPGRGLLNVGFMQVEDKPFIITEWASCTPNQWKAEAAPLMAFYGMFLQDWDALYHFAGSRSYMGNGWPSMSLWATETPHYIGQFPALTRAIYENHLAEGQTAVAKRLLYNEAFEGVDALNYPYSGYGYDGTHNLWVAQQALAVGKVMNKTADGQQHSWKDNIYAYWNTTTKVVTSNTGQLIWDYNGPAGTYQYGFVKVQSDKTQGVVGFVQNKTITLPAVTVQVGPTKFISLLFTSLDGRPLIDSGHILITALAKDKQYGTTYNTDGSRLTAAGGPPLLVQPVEATLTFGGGDIISAKPVDVYGVPLDQQLARNGNTFAIDGRYATYYYEVKRFVPVECDQANLDGVEPVNFGDYALMAGDWTNEGPGLTGDIDGDDVVGIWDLAQLALWWLEDCE